MKIHKKLVMALILTGLASNFCYAAANYNYTQKTVKQSSDRLQGQVVYVPAGAMVSAVLSNEIDSQTMTLGQNVNATLAQDFYYKDKLIAPTGSTISGTVILVKKATHANRNGQVMIKFSEIVTPQNFAIAISGVMKTDDNSGILKGGTKKDGAIDYAKNTGVGAAGGAVLGTALGALAQGSVGLGAVYGTALGAGAGLIKATIDKGDTVNIPANSVIEIYFNQPITTAPPEYTY